MNVTKNCYYNNYTQTHTFIQFLGGDHKRISCFLIWKPISKRTSLCPGFLVYLKQRGGAKQIQRKLLWGSSVNALRKWQRHVHGKGTVTSSFRDNFFLMWNPRENGSNWCFWPFPCIAKQIKSLWNFFFFWSSLPVKEKNNTFLRIFMPIHLYHSVY